MQLVRYLLLGLFDFFYESLCFASAFLLSSFNFALGWFYPAERNGEIHTHEEMLTVVNERDCIRYIFLVTDLVVFCILVEISLIFTDHRLVLVLMVVYDTSDEGELQIAAASNTGKEQE